MASRTIFAVAISLGASALAAAQPAQRYSYLKPGQLEAATILPTPPANDSWKTIAELAELHRIEQTRTPAEVAQARADEAEESIFLFSGLLGTEFTREHLPLTALLSDRVRGSASVAMSGAKDTFRRPRPYHLDSSLKPVCKTTDDRKNYSYPSGHGVSGYLFALVVAQMVPDKRDAILARADEYAYHREVCGVHYPSDEAASRVAAYAIYGALQGSAQFKADLEKAAAEFRAARERVSR